MREVLKEGDVISAEIQSVYNDGSLALHTRSVKYGKVRRLEEVQDIFIFAKIL